VITSHAGKVFLGVLRESLEDSSVVYSRPEDIEDLAESIIKKLWNYDIKLVEVSMLVRLNEEIDALRNDPTP
jgi:hypothetical protein